MPMSLQSKYSPPNAQPGRSISSRGSGNSGRRAVRIASQLLDYERVQRHDVVDVLCGPAPENFHRATQYSEPLMGAQFDSR